MAIRSPMLRCSKNRAWNEARLSSKDLGNVRSQEMREKIVALKSQSWVYLVGVFAVLIVVGILTS